MGVISSWLMNRPVRTRIPGRGGASCRSYIPGFFSTSPRRFAVAVRWLFEHTHLHELPWLTNRGHSPHQFTQDNEINVTRDIQYVCKVVPPMLSHIWQPPVSRFIVAPGKNMTSDDAFKKEKKWPLLYLRSEKLHRAKQLGIEYPRKTRNMQAREIRVNVLFVCSKNQWRSPTAEKVFSMHELISARSRGTSSDARRKITSTDIKWADVVLVMEEKHKQRITAQYPGESRYKDIYVLDIPDEYRYMDEELVKILQECVPPLVQSA